MQSPKLSYAADHTPRGQVRRRGGVGWGGSGRPRHQQAARQDGCATRRDPVSLRRDGAEDKDSQSPPSYRVSFGEASTRRCIANAPGDQIVDRFGKTVLGSKFAGDETRVTADARLSAQ